MENGILIEKILLSRSVKDVVDVNNYASETKAILRKIHPDVCSHPQANSAFIKFMELKKLFDDGFVFDDDSGNVRIKENLVKFEGDKSLIDISFNNYKIIYQSANENFKRYLPDSFKDGEITLDDNYLSLKDVTLPEEHARWVLSRLLEFSGYMESIGYTHNGINTDSFLVNPKTHGIKIISFYHVKPTGRKLDSVSARYRLFYPQSVFDKKLSEPKNDVELSKRTVCFILGDKSGVGVKLKKSITEQFSNFLIKTNLSAIDAFVEWKKLLKDNYESKFYELCL